MARRTETTGQEMLERAISHAVQVHAGQVDKQGAPYILHPLYVMGASMTVAREQGMHESDVLKVGTVAVLHDVVEDGPPKGDHEVGRVYLQMLDLPGDVIEDVLAVTRKPGEPYLGFVKRAARRSYRSFVVKREDIRHNLTRGGCPESLKDRYAKALAVLAEFVTPRS